MLAHMFLALLLEASPGDGPQPVTRKNLQTHPEIRLVRTEYELIERALAEGRLTKETSEFPDCLMYQGDLTRSVWRDDGGRIRLLVVEQGSDDSAITLRHYYDDAGRLRFVFITGGAVNDSKLEHRVWLSPVGKRLWEEHKYVAGPGYTFPRVWPEKELATNATERWSRALRCERAVADDPDEGTRNGVGRFIALTLYSLETIDVSEELIDALVVALDRPSHLDRTKSLANLQIIAEKSPGSRALIWAKGQHLIRTFAVSSVFDFMRELAQEIQDLCEPRE